MDDKKRKLDMFELGRYDDQFQVGLVFSVHSHGEKRHAHIWVDLGFYYVQVTIGEANATR
jgi:hypothetical protein